jgi:hypothetical protein
MRQTRITPWLYENHGSYGARWLSRSFSTPGAGAIIKRCDMGKYEKLLFVILKGTSDANIAFDDLRQLLLRLGFEERKRGSHHTFRKERIEEKINLQRDDSHAKAYQVRQVRAVILKYKLGGELENA